MPTLTVLWSYRKQIALMLLVVGVVVIIQTLYSRVRSLERENGRLAGDVADCEVLSAEIDKARQEAEQREQAVRDRVVVVEKEVARVRTVYQDRRREILVAPVASTDAAAIDFLRQTAPRSSQW